MTEKKVRIMMATVGVCICGVSVGLFRLSLFGTDPFQCFVNGLWNVIPLNFGTLYTIINLIMLIGIYLIDRHYIGIATFINIFGMGYIIDFTTKTLGRFFEQPTMGVRIGLILVAIVIMCFASSFYFTADLGVSTYDAVALIIAKKKGWRFQLCRIGTDLICVAIGLLFQAVVGVGTVITAFFMGPLIEFFSVHAARPFLKKWSVTIKQS